MPDSDTPVTGMRAAACPPEVMPQHSTVARIHCPHMVGRSDIERIVELHDRALDVHIGVLARAYAPNDNVGRRAARGAIEPRYPGECEVLHCGAVDLG